MGRKARYKKRADGRFHTQVSTGEYDDMGKPIRIPLYGKTSRELEDKVDALKQQIKGGKYVIRNDITFEDYAREYVELYKSTREYNTQRMYEDILKAYLFPAFGKMVFQDIKKTSIQKLINDNKDHPRTCEQIKIVMTQILNSAVDDRLIIETPWRKIELPKYRPPKRRILTKLEEEALLKADFTPEEYMIVMILFGCGLRLEELLALCTDDVDTKENEIVVTHAIVFKNNRPLRKEIPKSPSGDRRVPIPEFLSDAVKIYVKRIQRSAKGGKSFLFTYKGEPYSKSHFYDAWGVIIGKMNKAVGTEEDPEPITGLTSRIFRYNFATILYYSDISLKKAVEYMGHADEKMIIQVYAQLDNERENAKEKLKYIRPGMARTS